jgi:hypothetical protein
MMNSVSTKLVGNIEHAEIHELQEVMEFICSQDHTANHRVAMLRDTIVGRLAVLGSESSILERHSLLIPGSIFGEVIICMSETELFNLSHKVEIARLWPVKLRPMENVSNANQLAWKDILRALGNPSGFEDRKSGRKPRRPPANAMRMPKETGGHFNEV